jgi:hypothetical protein
MISRLADKRLYIADLVRRIAEMELGAAPMHALAYRVVAKRLHQAAAGFPEAALAGTFGRFNPQVAEVLENRHFDVYGLLPGSRARDCQALAYELFISLGVRPPLVGDPPEQSD